MKYSLAFLYTLYKAQEYCSKHRYHLAKHKEERSAQHELQDRSFLNMSHPRGKQNNVAYREEHHYSLSKG